MPSTCCDALAVTRPRVSEIGKEAKGKSNPNVEVDKSKKHIQEGHWELILKGFSFLCTPTEDQLIDTLRN